MLRRQFEVRGRGQLILKLSKMKKMKMTRPVLNLEGMGSNCPPKFGHMGSKTMADPWNIGCNKNGITSPIPEFNVEGVGGFGGWMITPMRWPEKANEIFPRIARIFQLLHVPWT